MWQISSSDGTRWVRCDDRGDISTSPGLVVESDADVPLIPGGGDYYHPSGRTDPVAAYLRAVNQLGAGARTVGMVPAVPVRRRAATAAAPAGPPPGVAY